MVHLKISDKTKAEQFANIFKNMKVFTNEIVFNFENERLYMQGMDSAHVSMFELVLNSSWFEEYKVDKPIVAGINTEILSKVISCKKTDHSIYIDCDDVKFSITFIDDSIKSKHSKKKYTLNIMDIDVETLGIPECDYNVDIEFDTKSFKSVIEDVGIFGENIQLCCDEENILLKCKEDTCDSEVTLLTDQVRNYSIGDNSEATFCIKYLQIFMQFYKLSDYIWVHFSEDVPIQVRYNLDNSNTQNNQEEDEGDEEDEEIVLKEDDENNLKNNNYIRFYLAPKIDDDDDGDVEFHDNGDE